MTDTVVARDSYDAVRVSKGLWYHGTIGPDRHITVRRALLAPGWTDDGPPSVARVELVLGEKIFEGPYGDRRYGSVAAIVTELVPRECLPLLAYHFNPSVRKAALQRLAGREVGQ